MKSLIRKSTFLSIIFFIINLTFVNTAYGQATLTSDQTDYAPGSVCTLTGSGFYPNELVNMQVLHADETPSTGEDHGSWVVTADESGNFVTTWHVCEDDCLDSTLRASATGQSSGYYADVIFTDANLNNFSVGAQSGSLTYGTAGTVTYTFNVNANNSSGNANVVMSATGLPAGILSSSFSPASFTLAPNGSQTVVFTINTSNTTKVPSGTFTITATGGGGSGSKSDTGTLVIGKKAITGSVTANNKVYDALTTATIATRSLSGVLVGDVVTYTGGTAVFLNKNVGTAKTVNATGLVFGGTDSGNYTVNTTASTTADITQRPLIVTAAGVNKVYNGDAIATVTLTNNRIAGDVVTGAFSSASFADANVGTGKTITVSGITISGTDAGNYNANTTATATANITAKALTGSFTADNKVYNGNTSATVLTRSLTGVISPDDVSLVGGTATFSNKNVGNGKTVSLAGATLSGANSGNYSLSSVSTTTANITPLAIVYAITAADKVYNATTAATIISRTLTGVIPGDNVNPAGGTATFSDKNVGTGKTVTAVGLSLGGGDKDNYSFNSTATDLADITPASLTPAIIANDKVYDATTTATLSSQSVSPILLSDNVTLIVGAANFADANAGIGKTVTATSLSLGGTDGGNYLLSAATATDLADISKADALVSVVGYSDVYDAASHSASGTATGVGGADLSSGLDFGASYTDVPGGNAHWTFTGGTNYLDESGDVAITISKADALVSVGGYSGVYDAASHNASGTATGVGGADLSSGLDFGASYTDVPGGNAHWTFTGGTNYLDESGDVAITISKADALVSVGGYSGVYDAASHNASGTATGVGGADLSSGLDFGASYTDVPGGNAHWTFTGGTNYLDESGDVAITISKADALVSVGGYSGVYDAASHGASGTAIGVGGADLSSGLDFGASYTDVPGGNAHWTFTGGTNYLDESGDVAITISKADALVSVGGYSGVYDAASHGASGTATGVGGADLSSGLDFGASYTDVPGGNAHWTFTGGTNYLDESGDVAITISKAEALVSVGGYSGVYDAASHGASGTATGVGGADLSSGLDFGASYTDVPGGNAHWTFTGGTNYLDESGDVAITISKAEALVSVGGYSGVYDAASHGASGTATGVGGADLSSGLDFGASYTDVPGGNAHWTFTGGTNYLDESGDVTITISKAEATVTAQADTKDYDGNTSSSVAPIVTGLISPDAVATAPTQTYDNRNAGTGKTMTASGLVINDGNSGGNYDISYITNTSGVINKITATVTAQTDTKNYDGTTSSSVAPIVTGLISPDAVGTAPTQTYDNRNAGTGKTMTASGLVINDGNSGGNYDISYITNTSGVINKITATVTAQTDTKNYDGTTSSSVAPIVTGLISPDAVGTAPTQTYDNRNAGTGKTMTASGLVINDGNSGGNYDISYVTNTSGIINKITATVTAQTDTKNYDGNTSSSVAPIVTGLISPDAVATAPTQTYDNRNAGTGKTMTASGLIINDGNSGGNYNISYVSNTTGIINKITATVTAQTNTKNYDGTTSSIAVPVVTGLISPDAVATAPIQVYDNRNAGTGKTLTASGLVINDGNAGGNYNISYVTNTTGVINKITATVTAQTNTKNYDGTTSSIAVPVVTGLISPDAVGTAPSQTYDNRNVGTGKTMTASGLVINDSNSGGNYNISYVTNTTGVINKITATVTAQTATKVYNGTTSSSVVPVVTGLIAPDAVSTSPIQVYDTPFVGTGKTLTASGLVINDGNSGGNYNISYVTTNTGVITNLGVATSVTVSPNSAQYSDRVTFTARIVGGSPLVSGGPQAAASATFKVGTQVMGTVNLTPDPSIPADLIAVLADVQLLETVSGQMEPTAPGTRNVSAVFNSPNVNFALTNNPAVTPITINKEDARINFSGTSLVATQSLTSGLATVTLRATVQDITATPDAGTDIYFGDIRKAKVRFLNNNVPIVISGVTDASGWVLSGITLVNPLTDIKTGVVSINWPVDIGAASDVEYTIGMEVSGYYVRNSQDDNTVVTVYKPDGDFITGGGHFIVTQSNGRYMADAGKKTNFGFNVKYNKKGTNLQGNMNIIFRRTESGIVRTYQIKANSMTSLGVNIANPNAQTAVFVSKSNLTDITNPLAPIAKGGGLTLQVNMIDKGEPGTYDEIAISLYEGSTLLYSSNWVNNNTALKVLTGGNLVVHSGFSSTAIVKNSETESIPNVDVVNPIPFNVTVYPNPTNSEFNLVLESNTNEKLFVEVYDLLGRKVKQMEENYQQPLLFGDDLPAGSYVTIIRQGANVKTIKLIKQK